MTLLFFKDGANDPWKISINELEIRSKNITDITNNTIVAEDLSLRMELYKNIKYYNVIGPSKWTQVRSNRARNS